MPERSINRLRLLKDRALSAVCHSRYREIGLNPGQRLNFNKNSRTCNIKIPPTITVRRIFNLLLF